MNLRVEGSAVTFWLRVKPRSSRERLTLDSNGEARLELHAPATEGQANEACIEFFARMLGVPRSNVRLVTGEKSRRKLIRIRGGEEMVRNLKSALGSMSSASMPGAVAALALVSVLAQV